MNAAAAVAGRPAREQVRADVLEIETEAQRVYMVASNPVLKVLAKMGLRWQWVRRRRSDDYCRPQVEAARELVTLWNAGASEADLRPFANFLNTVLDRLSTGCAVRPLHVIDHAEQMLEAEETLLQQTRLIRDAEGKPLTAKELLHEADVAEREGHIEIEKSRALRRRARQLQQLSCLLLPIGIPDTLRAGAGQPTFVQNTVLLVAVVSALWMIVALLADQFGPVDPGNVEEWARHARPGSTSKSLNKRDPVHRER